MHINPDHFLETLGGRLVTSERNEIAWAACHEALAEALAQATPDTKVYVLVGAQGSGKSTWARAKDIEEPSSIIFDAILVKRAEREAILRAARNANIPAVAVWFRTPLSVCLSRNAARPADQVANEQGLRNVMAAIEPPTSGEGFSQVMQLEYSDA